MSVTAKRAFTFSTLVIAALSLALAVGAIGNQQALAANLCGSGLGCGGASNYGCDGSAVSAIHHHCLTSSVAKLFPSTTFTAASAFIISVASITFTSALLC